VGFYAAPDTTAQCAYNPPTFGAGQGCVLRRIYGSKLAVKS
jgi:hypothetical protein